MDGCGRCKRICEVCEKPSKYLFVEADRPWYTPDDNPIRCIDCLQEDIWRDKRCNWCEKVEAIGRYDVWTPDDYDEEMKLCEKCVKNIVEEYDGEVKEKEVWNLTK